MHLEIHNEYLIFIKLTLVNEYLIFYRSIILDILFFENDNLLVANKGILAT
jgi:hypothetical protein